MKDILKRTHKIIFGMENDDIAKRCYTGFLMGYIAGIAGFLSENKQTGKNSGPTEIIMVGAFMGLGNMLISFFPGGVTVLPIGIISYFPLKKLTY